MLIARLMPPACALRIRFCTCHDLASQAIRIAEDFWASHCEAVLPDGYLGAHPVGGVLLRPIGYDKATLARESFVDLPADAVTAAAWDKALRSKIGEPYDFAAILGIALRAGMHVKGHSICSAFLDRAADACGWWQGAHCIAPYELTPRDLMVRLSGRPDLVGLDAAFAP